MTMRVINLSQIFHPIPPMPSYFPWCLGCWQQGIHMVCQCVVEIGHGTCCSLSAEKINTFPPTSLPKLSLCRVKTTQYMHSMKYQTCLVFDTYIYILIYMFIFFKWHANLKEKPVRCSCTKPFFHDRSFSCHILVVKHCATRCCFVI